MPPSVIRVGIPAGSFSCSPGANGTRSLIPATSVAWSPADGGVYVRDACVDHVRVDGQSASNGLPAWDVTIIAGAASVAAASSGPLSLLSCAPGAARSDHCRTGVPTSGRTPP
jgi:hypothetical protein